MGCCEATNNKASFDNYSSKIKEILDLGSVSSLRITLKYFQKRFPEAIPPLIDREIVCINKISLNPLGYSLFLGNLALFKFLKENGASLKAMDDLLEKRSIRAINVLCYKGFIDLLEYYLPIFMLTYQPDSTVFKSFTLDLKDSIITRHEYDLAIHSACRAGMVTVVSFLFKYFDQYRCPKEFYIYSVDDAYGEDCGLIACRVGAFGLVKFLHTVLKVDFRRLNANRENAIMICVSGYNKSPNYTFLECLEYLVNEVGLDITYMYEELLFMADGTEVVRFLEMELEKKGVFVKKKDVNSTFIGRKDGGRIEGKEIRPDFTKEELEFLRKNDSSVLSSIGFSGVNEDNTISSLMDIKLG